MADVMKSASEWWNEYLSTHEVNTLSDVMASLLSDLRSCGDTAYDSWQDYTYLHRYESLFNDSVIRMYVEMLLKEKKVRRG